MKTKKQLKLILTRKPWSVVVTMGMFAIIGLITVLISHAVAPSTGVETENGTLGGDASIINDPNASGGKAIRFGTCNALPFNKPTVAAMRASSKKAFAYYFPVFPVSIDNKDPAKDQYAAQWLDPLGSSGRYAGEGGYLRDRPLPRPPRPQSNWKQLDFEVEIRQAIATGLDGFIWEYNDMAKDPRWLQLPAMLAAAHAVDPGFRIMLSPDANPDSNITSDELAAAIAKVKNDPSIYRLNDGRVVLAPFHPEQQPISFWSSVHDKLAAQGVNTALVPIFVSSSMGMDAWNDYVYGYSSWGSRWVSATTSYANQGQNAHALGRIWMSPVAFEDVRPNIQQYWEASNSGELRASFEQAMAGNADWVSLTTWNDYTESWVAPSQERGYAVLDVAAFYIAWMKMGQAPAITQDTLYYFHRNQPTTAPYDTAKQTDGPMLIPYGDSASNQVELLAFLAAPGKLVITQGTNVQSMDAPTGMTSFKVPLVPGTTPKFQLQRNGRTVKNITSHTPIAAQVTYQNMMYHAGSSSTTCQRPL